MAMHIISNRLHNGSQSWYPTALDRLFDEVTRNIGFAPDPKGEGIALAVDVSETPDAWIVRADLPGVEPALVEVSVTGNVLNLRGEKKCEPTQETESARRCERRAGTFARSLEFPTDVDGARVEARFKHGVLTVTLPKAEASRPRTIAVKVE